MGQIESVDVVSTGTVRIRPEHVESTGKPMAWWLLTSRRWTKPRPINVYVIKHDAGVVLFDTGQDRHSITDAHYFPRGIVGWLYRRLAQFQIGPNETLTAQLADIGCDVRDITHVVLSHLHQDHIGGLPELAELGISGPIILVAAKERACVNRRFAALDGYLEKHINVPGLRWQPIDGTHDIFDDGTLVIVPTPGHTPGSISLLLRCEGMPPMLFVGDLTYDAQLLDAGRVPGVGVRKAMQASTREVHKLAQQHPGLLVLAAHDPAAADALPQRTRKNT